LILKIPVSVTDFQNTGLSLASTKLAVKYMPGRWNIGHLATLLPHQKRNGKLVMHQKVS